MVNTKDTEHKSQEASLDNSCFKDVPPWLTEEFFQEFLQRDFPNYTQITKFLVKPAVPTGENYMTVMLRIIIEVKMSNNTHNTTSYMLKIKPTPESLQIMIKEWQIFMKEYTTYTKYIPKFEQYYRDQGVDVKLAPRILVKENLSTTTTEDFLIFEDLSLKGFRNANRQMGLDMLHTKAALRKIAQFHAASARYAELEEPYPDMYNQSLTCEKDLFVDHRLNIGKLFRDHMHLYGDFKHLEAKLKKYAEEQFDPFQLKSDRNPNEFNVLTHGDFWVNNIMFQYADDGTLMDTLLIDFQMSRYGSPAQDLTYILYSSTQLDIKLKYFDYFVAYYHKHLIQSLQLIKYEGKLPKLKDLHIALYKHDYWAYTTVAALLPIVLCESRDDANAEVLLGECGEEFKHSMYSNKNYAKNMEILLPWLDRRGAFDL